MRTWDLMHAAPLAMLLLPQLGWARPQFISLDPQLTTEAEQAWGAATACTGWEAPAHAEVEIVREYVSGGYTGGAFIDDQGLYRIALGPDLLSSSRMNRLTERTLVHEISHAWASGGPAGLNEGRADLLADCVVSRLPHLAPLDPDPGTELENMPDLRDWDDPHIAPLAYDLETRRRDAYLASARFLRVVATVVPREALWPRDGVLTWEDLTALLEARGPSGATVLAVLEGGRERQRAALSDQDRDGVPFLAEVLQSTDPTRWDSDGDGWWDGAEVPTVAAIPLPPDGTPVCSGFTAGARGATVQVLTQGQLRASTLPWVRVQAGSLPLPDDPRLGVQIPPGHPILLALEGPLHSTTGGTYALVGGRGLVTDWNCRSTPRYTVWVENPLATPLLDDFAAALDEHIPRADSLLDGPPPQRLVVTLGAPNMDLEDGTLHLSQGQVDWAWNQQRPDALAALAVAIHRVWGQEEHPQRWDTAEALAHALMDAPPDLPLVSPDLSDTEDLFQRAREQGWGPVLEGE